MDDRFDDATVVGNRDLIKQLDQANQAYVVVIVGPNVGQMFRVGDGGFVGRDPAVNFSLSDSEISRKHAEIVKTGDKVEVVDLNSTNGTFVNGKPITRHQLRDGDKIQVGTTTILKFSYHDDLEEQFQRKMLQSAIKDGLTKAFNKSYFMDRLESELAYALRHKGSLCLVMFDLDHFKNINDTWGHLAGDYVLKTLASGILKSVRQEDMFARYGGEEFAMLCRGINKKSGASFGDRLRAWVEGTRFVYQGTRLPVTVSLGVAAVPQDKAETPVQLIELADAALYKAKEGGRNRVCTS